MKNDNQGEAILERPGSDPGGMIQGGDPGIDKKGEAQEEDQNGKTRAQRIIDGEIEPEPHERGLLNLRKRVPFSEMSPEKRAEIARKGAEAVNKLHGEKKTARESLEAFLTLKITDEIVAGADLDPSIAERLKRSNPDATLYDLIQAVAVGRALDGNIKAAEYIRDTHGDKPVDRVDISGEIMTEADRAMIARIGARLDDPSLVIAKDVTPLPGEDD